MKTSEVQQLLKGVNWLTIYLDGGKRRNMLLQGNHVKAKIQLKSNKERELDFAELALELSNDRGDIVDVVPLYNGDGEGFIKYIRISILEQKLGRNSL
jgi:hypothetical protein